MQVSGRMLPPAGTPTPSPSPAYHAAALHPAPWGVQRTSWDAFQPESPAQPPAPPSTPQVQLSIELQERVDPLTACHKSCCNLSGRRLLDHTCEARKGICSVLLGVLIYTE